MSANTIIPQIETASATGWLIVNPIYQELFSLHDLHTATAVLNLPGVVVNGHVTRNVSRVALGEMTVYLKREHTVKWKTRLVNAIAGFGFVSLSEREARVIAKLNQHDLAGPEWIAYGHANGESFLLLRGIEPSQRVIDPLELAREIAAIHRAGINQPDLFFKHLLHDLNGRITILDWQQATIHKQLSLTQRQRALAALHATTPNVIARRQRVRFLKEYLANTGQNLNDWKAFAHGVLKHASELAQRKNIRRQVAQQADAKQLLVRIEGETVCAIPEIADDLRHPEIIRQLHDHRRKTPPVMLPAAACWRANRYRNVNIALRRSRWRSPELKLARLIMHLEKHGITGPKILAYGQHVEGVTATAFVAYTPAIGTTLPLPKLLQVLHRIGVALREPTPQAEPFRFINGQVMINDPTCFELVDRIRWKHVERANRWLRIHEHEQG